jgi:cation/acetate symporter
MPIDANSAAPVRSRPALLLAGFVLAVIAATAALVVFARTGASATSIGSGFWVLGLATAAAIAFAGGLRHLTCGAPVFAGLAMATQTLSAAFYVGLAGAVFALGYDGLAFSLGLGAGCLLMQLVVAPRLAQTAAPSLPAFFAIRYSSRAVGALAGLVLVASMLTLLAAELMAAGLVGAHLLGIDFAAAAAIAGCAIFACFVLRGVTGGSWATGMLYPILFVALFVPLVQVSAEWYGLPIPQLAYANALWQLQGLEEALLERELADPAFIKPMMTAFLSLSPLNFGGIVLGLAAGVAALPGLAGMPAAGHRAREARLAALWSLVFVVLVLMLVPAIAAYARLSIATLISDRTASAALPEWVFAYGRLGLVEVCGRAATDAAAVAQACAALPDAGTALRLQDAMLSPDMVTLAFPEITGLDRIAAGLIAAAALSVALVTAHGPLTIIVRAAGFSAAADATRRSARLGSYAIAALVLVVAALAAVARPAGILDIAAAALIIAAAGLFPALAAGLWWRRANAWGAGAAILVGPALVLAYLLGARYFPVAFFELTSALSSAGKSGGEYFAELKDAWLAAEPGAARDAAWAALEQQARGAADWWGIGGLATALLALPAGFFALIVGSLLTPATRHAEKAA